MLAMVFAIAALIIALVIGLGRQITVFTVFKPGLWLFRNYNKKRTVGILLVLSFSAISIVLGTENANTFIIIISGIFSIVALVFNLELLFPSLQSVDLKSLNEINKNEDVESQVLVVEMGKETRAYPLEDMVMPRHIIHDKMGEYPIVITYCALCRTGLVFKSTHENTELKFKVVGVFRRNLIMEDNMTNSLWQQATGECINGPLKGKNLELLPSFQIPWSEAKKIENLKLAFAPNQSKKAILATKIGFKLLKLATNYMMAPGYTKLSKQISPREVVFGININGKAKAYPLSVVKNSGKLHDSLNGIDLDIEFNPHLNTLQITRRDGGNVPIVEKHWWLGWNEFHPNTEVYKK